MIRPDLNDDIMMMMMSFCFMLDRSFMAGVMHTVNILISMYF